MLAYVLRLELVALLVGTGLAGLALVYVLVKLWRRLDRLEERVEDLEAPP